MLKRNFPMSRQNQIQTNEIYKNIPLEDIPWNIETPPQLLVELVDGRKVQPCKTIDLGCGSGNYAIYLATRGFEMTGMDCAPTAIKIAKENAQKKGVKCNFFAADVVDDLGKINQTWDFAYDWGLLHHIFPRQRPKYLANVHRILNPRCKYLSASLSEKDRGFGGSGKYRKTQLGTLLYFSSEDELRELFETHFEIIDQRTVEIKGKFESHTFNYLFTERK
ncbi:MAG: class I SAM-dependent methyltransferase [Planctomycetota bacterium]|nr:MAG: class I SAM-dependent methyltransferase [Planctomycetota bacterium]